MEKMLVHRAGMIACLQNGTLDLSIDTREVWNGISSFEYYNREEMPEGESLCFVHVIDTDLYEELSGEYYALSKDEILLSCDSLAYSADSIIMPDQTEEKISNKIDKIPSLPGYNINNRSTDGEKVPEIWLVVQNLPEFLEKQLCITKDADYNYFVYRFEYGMYLKDDYNRVDEICQELRAEVGLGEIDGGEQDFTVYSHPQKVDRGKMISGGLLFVMIILNIIFVFVTALIMYYKQISEGYEDSKRFAIMKKIGISANEIRKSIKSQMLMVFGFPLGVAGLHVLMAHMIIYRILEIAFATGLTTRLIYTVIGISFFIITVVYAVVYLLTSRVYYKIVNGAAEE